MAGTLNNYRGAFESTDRRVNGLSSAYQFGDRPAPVPVCGVSCNNYVIINCTLTICNHEIPHTHTRTYTVLTQDKNRKTNNKIVRV